MRPIPALFLAFALGLVSLAAPSQSGTAETPRGIRRDIPLTRSIRRALDAGTRDFSGRPGPAYWQLEADYTIHVRLDRENQTLVGEETILLHNNSPDALGEIVLRLDHNIFRPDVARGSSVPAETTEGMVVTKIVVQGDNVNLTPRPRGRRAGGEGGGASVQGLDQTVARIGLTTPIPAKSTATLEIAWHTKLPGGDGGRGHRMTQRWGDTLFQPTQWFPRVAKYDDLRGWDRSVYLGPSEFYNNFGRFDVRIDVPADWLVSGTGVLANAEEILTSDARERLSQALTSSEEITIIDRSAEVLGLEPVKGDRRTWRFVADKVNDFAWATAENYTWKATRAVIPGKGPIPIHMLFLPERANRFANAGALTRHALEFYSELWAPYPFPQLTLQDGPSDGMEYPMVINSNQGAADHETGHQWWPMMVGTNETWYGWMDEGLNVYMNRLSDAHRRGRAARLDGLGQSYGRHTGDEGEPPMMWNANYAGDLYSFQTYGKASLMLSMLGGMVGDDAVQKAISAYSQAWAFKHPSPWDFVHFMSRELGQDLGWFWASWLWTTDSVDGSIEQVQASGTATVVTVRQSGQMPSPVVLKVTFADDGPPPEGIENARVQDDGSVWLTWPVDVWFDGRRTFDARLDFGGRTIQTITLDPAGRFPDTQPRDNTWTKAL